VKTLNKFDHPELTGRTLASLAAAGITTEDQLLELSLHQASQLKGMGQQALNQVRTVQRRLPLPAPTDFHQAAIDPYAPAPQQSPPAAAPPAQGASPRAATRPLPPGRPALDPYAPAWTEQAPAPGPAAMQYPVSPQVPGPAPASEPEPADVVGELGELTLAQRIELCRQARPYVQRELIEMEQYKARAVTHPQLLKLVKPVVLKYGIRWRIVDSTLLQTQQIEKGGKIWFSDLIRFTFRFKRTEDPDQTDIGNTYDFEDIVVIARGLDNQDKGPGKAQTYAEKQALFSLLNLERGDDPDLIYVELGPDVPEDVEARIRKLRELAEADPEIEDVDAYLRSLAGIWSKQYGRRAPNIYALPVASLDKFIENLQDRARTKAPQKPAEPAPVKPLAKPAARAPAQPKQATALGQAPPPPTVPAQPPAPADEPVHRDVPPVHTPTGPQWAPVGARKPPEYDADEIPF